MIDIKIRTVALQYLFSSCFCVPTGRWFLARKSVNSWYGDFWNTVSFHRSGK